MTVLLSRVEPVRTKFWMPIAMLAAGIALIAAAVAEGEVEVSLFIIFPVFTGSSFLFLLAIVLVISSFIAGFVLISIDHTWTVERMDASYEGRSSNASRSKTKYGGVLLFGPIPIAFGSNKRMALIMLVVGIVLAVVMLALLLAFA